VGEVFSYDRRDRLIDWVRTGANGTSHANYVYDARDNLRRQIGPSGSVQFGVQAGGAPHQITASTAGQYAYNARGDQFEAPGRQIDFTAFDLPQQVRSTDGHSSTFEYDAFQERVVETKDTGERSYYVPDMFRASGAGNTAEQRYIVGLGGHSIAEIAQSGAAPGGSAVYLHSDAVGTVGLVTGGNGTPIDRMAYEPYGRRLPAGPGWTTTPASGASTGFGGQKDEDIAGLIDMNGRMYDPVLATFVSADPIIGDIVDISNGNPYGYCRRSPVSYADPSGFQAEAPITNPDPCSVCNMEDVVVTGDAGKAASPGGKATPTPPPSPEPAPPSVPAPSVESPNLSVPTDDGGAVAANPGPLAGGQPPGINLGTLSLAQYERVVQYDRPVSSRMPWGWLLSWIKGTRNSREYYGPGTMASADMSVSAGGKALREAFYSSGCPQDLRDGEYGSGRAAWETMVPELAQIVSPWPIVGNGTAAQVGGFGGAKVVRGEGGTVTFTVPNVAGTKSFFYHVVPDRTGTSGPMRSVYQVFQWTEPLDRARCTSPAR